MDTTGFTVGTVRYLADCVLALARCFVEDPPLCASGALALVLEEEEALFTRVAKLGTPLRALIAVFNFARAVNAEFFRFIVPVGGAALGTSGQVSLAVDTVGHLAAWTDT